MTTGVVPILRVADALRAVAWYADPGLAQVVEHRFETHLPADVGIRRDDAQIHRAVHARDQPRAREVTLADPDGNRLRVAEPALRLGAQRGRPRVAKA